MPIREEYLAHCKRKVAEIHERLKPLEDGSTQFSRREAGGTEWIDITDQWIRDLKREVVTYEAIIRSLEASALDL